MRTLHTSRHLTPCLVAICLVVGLATCDVNAVPRQDEAVNAAWSQVLNQYQRRAELIPNLVETVKGYAHQEQQVLVAVTAARAEATQIQLPADLLTNPEAFRQFEQNQSALRGAHAGGFKELADAGLDTEPA